MFIKLFKRGRKGVLRIEMGFNQYQVQGRKFDKSLEGYFDNNRISFQEEHRQIPHGKKSTT